MKKEKNDINFEKKVVVNDRKTENCGEHSCEQELTPEKQEKPVYVPVKAWCEKK